MKTINIIGSKGGVGTTTVTALFAAALTTSGSRVVVIDQTGTGDVGAIVADGSLHVQTEKPHDHEQIDYVIVDHPSPNTNRHRSLTESLVRLDSNENKKHEFTLLVTTNCYLAVRHAVLLAPYADGLVINYQYWRHLGCRDIEAVTAIPDERTLIVRNENETANRIDGGSATIVTPRQLQRLRIDEFIQQLAAHSS